MRDLVVQSNETKHSFYEFVRRAWDLKDDRLSIEYDAANSPNGYVWSTPPVRGHDGGYSWNETMLWISMAIGHRALGEEMWTNLSDEWKSRNIINAEDWTIHYDLDLFADFVHRMSKDDAAKIYTDSNGTEWTMFWFSRRIGHQSTWEMAWDNMNDEERGSMW